MPLLNIGTRQRARPFGHLSRVCSLPYLLLGFFMLFDLADMCTVSVFRMLGIQQEFRLIFGVDQNTQGYEDTRLT